MTKELNRDVILQIRLTKKELNMLKTKAKAITKGNVSKYVRAICFNRK